MAKHKSIILENEVFNMTNICKDILLFHHPELEKTKLSKNKIMFEVMRYYIKSEPKFKHLLKTDIEEK